MHNVFESAIPVDIGVSSQRRRIIEAMIESCAEKTYAGTTIADIVRRASISRTTFYKRVGDKRRCFDAALDFCIEVLQAAAAESRSPSDSPPETVRKAVARLLELMAERPSLGHLAIAESVSVEPATIERYRRMVIPAVENLWDSAGVPRQSHTDPRLAFGRAQVLIFDWIAAGRTRELPELLPEIVYISLLPFAGHAEAVKQARLAGGQAAQGPEAHPDAAAR
jgi:AcrR family transcriptional regulator